MKMERVRFVLQKLYRKRIEKYCVWTGQCEGFVHHHFRVTHPDWKKTMVRATFRQKGKPKEPNRKNIRFILEGLEIKKKQKRQKLIPIGQCEG